MASGDEILRPIVPVRLKDAVTGRSCVIYAMLDSGADTDFVAESVVEELGVPSWEKEMTVVTVERDVVGVRRLASFVLESVDGAYKATVESALVGRLATCSSDIPPVDRDLSPFPHLQDVPFERATGGVRMIIGAGHADTWVGGETRRGPQGGPIALSTSLGWTLLGVWGQGTPGRASISFLSSADPELQGDSQRICIHDFGVVSEEEPGASRENRHAIQGPRSGCGSWFPARWVGRDSFGRRPLQEQLGSSSSCPIAPLQLPRRRAPRPRVRSRPAGALMGGLLSPLPDLRASPS